MRWRLSFGRESSGANYDLIRRSAITWRLGGEESERSYLSGELGLSYGFRYRNKSLIHYRLPQVGELLDGTFLHNFMTLLPVFTEASFFSVSHWRDGMAPREPRIKLAREPNRRSEKMLDKAN
jgi:hypothetical protein